MAVPTVYRNTDASAPSLSGTAGDLTNLLNKCLVTGYGAKAAAGWSEVVNTNTGQKRVFKMGGGNQRYLWVDDTGPGAGGAREARARGWEVHDSSSSSDTIDYTSPRYGPFPNFVQAANGLFIRKSTTADATARDWIVVADDRTFYLFVKSEAAVGAAGSYFGFSFGDIYSYCVGVDAYSTVIIGRTSENSSSLAGAEALPQIVVNGGTGTGGSGGHYACRSVIGTLGSSNFTKFGQSAWQADISTTAGQVETLRGLITYPNAVDGDLWIWPIEVSDGQIANMVRGRLRGMYHQGHAITNFADGDTFSGATDQDYNGRDFLIIKQAGTGLVGAAGVYVIETTTWDTN